jgi:hypothetical protein
MLRIGVILKSRKFLCGPTYYTSTWRSCHLLPPYPLTAATPSLAPFRPLPSLRPAALLLALALPLEHDAATPFSPGKAAASFLFQPSRAGVRCLAESPSPSRHRPQRSAPATVPASQTTPRSRIEDSRLPSRRLPKLPPASSSFKVRRRRRAARAPLLPFDAGRASHYASLPRAPPLRSPSPEHPCPPPSTAGGPTPRRERTGRAHTANARGPPCSLGRKAVGHTRALCSRPRPALCCWAPPGI